MQVCNHLILECQTVKYIESNFSVVWRGLMQHNTFTVVYDKHIL